MSTPKPWTEIKVKQSKFETIEDLIHKNLLDNRQLVLSYEITLSSAHSFVEALLYLANKSKEPIKIVLNSVGGEVYAGLLVFDTIIDLIGQGIEVEVEARGLAASMGCIILQAGSRRTASKYTRFLIHEVSSFAGGTATEVEEKAGELRKVNNMLRDILAVSTGHPKKEIDKLWTKTDVWMSSDEALRWRLIDEVI